MGGKKKKASTGKVKKESKYKMPRAFDCPICDAKAAIDIKMDMSNSKATVKCKQCHQPSPPFEYALNRLSKPYDAFFAYYEEAHKKDRALLRIHNVALVPEHAAAGTAAGTPAAVVRPPGMPLEAADAVPMPLMTGDKDIDDLLA